MKLIRTLLTPAVSLLLGSAWQAQAAVAPYTTDANTLILYNFESITGSVITNAASTTSVNDGIYVNGTSATATVLATPATVSGYAGFGNALNNFSNATGFYGVGVDVSNDNAWNYDGATNQDDFNFSSAFFTNAATGVGAFTFEAMVYIPTLSPGTAIQQEIWCSDTATGTRTFQFRIENAGVLRFDAAPLGVTAYDAFFDLSTVTGTHAFAANTWFHVAVTYSYDGVNPATTKFYWTRADSGATQANLVYTLSGQAMTGFAAATSANLVFGNEGRTNGGMSEGTRGLLDEGRVSKVARAASEFIFTTAPGDADGDNLLDTWEIQYFGNLNQTGTGDPDGDGFNNAAEFAAGSNPTVLASTPSDTDGDGLTDSWEITNFGSIIAQNGSGDPDRDFATNLQEQAGSSNPNSAASWPDTDSDGLNDGWEILYFGNLATGNIDSDNDGASNAAEMAAGSSPIDINWTPTHSVLTHRWSFNGNLTDSVGTSTATLVDPDSNAAVGGTATAGASDVTLTGGASTTSAYINLGTNLIGGKATPVTIELWATQNAVQNWGRIFDFGSATTEYLFMSWTRGTTATQDQVEWVDGVTTNKPDTNQPYVLGTQYHIVMTLTPAVNTAGALTGGTRVTWYTSPASNTSTLVAKGTFDTTMSLINLNDVNNWLGRSQWAGDNVAAAAYDEVRIWNGALTSTEINQYQVAGPNAFSIADTDADGLPDAWEILYFGNLAQTASADPDNDGATNAAEYAAGSNPSVQASTPTDTDADGLPDAWEIQYFTNLAQTPTGDTDNDRNTNLAEYLAGTNPALNTSWPDADADSLNDGWEIFYFGSITAFNDLADPDNDGADNYTEQFAGTDPTNGDRDFDGLLDTWEVTYFTTTAAQTGSGDPDGDGFTNLQEQTAQSNPTVAASVPGDINGDGLADGHRLATPDLINTTSFNAGTNWTDTLAPAAGQNYLVAVTSLRTPTDTADYTFAGANLVLFTGGNLLVKGSGILTFPALILDGGRLHNGTNSNVVVTVAGGIQVTRASEIYAQNNGFIINSTVTGTKDLSITGASLVTFAGVNTFTGNLSVLSTAGGFTLGTTGVHKFAPAANGITNVISGTGIVTLNGAFNIDLATASTVSGSSWVLVTTTGVKTYGATFTVNGFTADAGAVGARKWTSGSYQFDEATSTLSVTAPPLTAIQTWRVTHFGDSANSGSGANLADPDNDGRSNLLEYALGSDPMIGNPAAPATLGVSGSFLTLGFQTTSEDLQSLVVEASNDLVTWTPMQTYSGHLNTGPITYIDNVTIGSVPRRFLRLSVTAP
ncbi:MAG: hypothetical protein RIQ79_29 [Verrucomicrobiota bacterium]